LVAIMAIDDWRNDQVSTDQQRRNQFVAEMKARQSAKIKELKDVLVTAGMCTLAEQADALGLSRSTTWSLLKGCHKSSGLSAKTINRILAKPQLSPQVRKTILEYVEEKAEGRYGHSRLQLRRFIAQLSIKRINGSNLEQII
jgi:hypothetical protein